MPQPPPQLGPRGPTGPEQAKPASKERPPDNPLFFRWLCYGEFVLVSLIMVAIFAFVLYSIAWIACEWRPEVHSRIVEAAERLSKNWKLALIVLIPLFFRPLAKFLINLKEVHGLKSGEEVRGKESPAEDYGSTQR